ncbi:hypothetical protein FNV43_RR16619 [Rhamnella rubrinervis]|uniref:Uncharacterized protein n=1 Tax=Rhamnella rubrinervis TaxID=2594499 RepID=A0A8K0MDD9_9ROSA|nr:hypothetical protein FNV43_RR16619 [Rhamnella rubrinervis]
MSSKYWKKSDNIFGTCALTFTLICDHRDEECNDQKYIIKNAKNDIIVVTNQRAKDLNHKARIYILLVFLFQALLLTKMTPISNTSNSSWNKQLSKRDEHVSFGKIREYELHPVVCVEGDGDDDDDDDAGFDFAPAA